MYLWWQFVAECSPAVLTGVNALIVAVEESSLNERSAGSLLHNNGLAGELGGVPVDLEGVAHVGATAMAGLNGLSADTNGVRAWRKDRAGVLFMGNGLNERNVR